MQFLRGLMGAGIWDAVRTGGPRHIRASLVPARIVTVTDRTTEDAALANLAADPGVAVRRLAAGFDGRGHADPDATWHSGDKVILSQDLLTADRRLPHDG